MAGHFIETLREAHLIFSRVLATLQVTLSVGRSVGWSVGWSAHPILLFWGFNARY